MDRQFAFDPINLTADIVITNGAVALTDGLGTAVLYSLFTHRRALAADTLPDGADGDRRGWWADPEMGSRLWLLCREKHLPVVIARAKEYAEEALAWMITKGKAKAVDVQVEGDDDTLALAIVITLLDGTVEEYSYRYAWRSAANAV